jgi:hypothetical protein
LPNLTLPNKSTITFPNPGQSFSALSNLKYIFSHGDSFKTYQNW